MPIGPKSLSSRHYGLDWLRIGAFGVLILYHIAMAFSPWHWVVTTGHAYTALIAPMAAVTPWRLGLLFAVSGYASATLVARAATPHAFAAERSRRLLVPLAFGMLAIVPLEMWVRVLEGGYPHGYLRFWLLDGWRVGTFYGVEFPSWEHLWFLVYLWTYSMLLAAFVATAGAARRMDRLAAWLSRGNRLLWAPIALMATIRLAALFVVPEGQGLLHDIAGHSQYLPLFALGYLVARRRHCGARCTAMPPAPSCWHWLRARSSCRSNCNIPATSCRRISPWRPTAPPDRSWHGRWSSRCFTSPTARSTATIAGADPLVVQYSRPISSTIQ